MMTFPFELVKPNQNPPTANEEKIPHMVSKVVRRTSFTVKDWVVGERMMRRRMEDG